MKKIRILSRAEMKHVQGGGSGINCMPGYCYNPDTDFCEPCEDTGRCKKDVTCYYYDREGGLHGGGCEEMGTTQCRCVKYEGGVAVESIPHQGCLA